MEKKYMKPEMVIAEIASCNLMSSSPHNVTIKTSETVDNPGLFESKGRNDDHESDGWSDGLW